MTPAEGRWEPAARISLVGRPGCHLCVVAQEVVEGVAAELGVDWEEVVIDEHPELLARHADEIPVVLVDGRPHQHWRVDPDRLRAALGGTSG